MSDMKCSQCGMIFKAGGAYGLVCPQGMNCGPIEPVKPIMGGLLYPAMPQKPAELPPMIGTQPAVTLPDVAKVVEEAGKVLEGVTPGPWAAGRHAVGVRGATGMDRLLFETLWHDDQGKTDMRFIAWCREGVPALITLATAQAAQIAGLTKERNGYKAEAFITRVEKDGAEDHATETADDLRTLRSKYRAVKAAHLEASVEAENSRARAEAAEAKVAELEAQIAGLEEAVDANWITHQRVVAAEAEAATLRTEVERLRGALRFISEDLEASEETRVLAARAALEGKA